MAWVKRFEFKYETIEDALESMLNYINYLIDNDLGYHLDDDPTTVEWRTVTVDDDDIAILKKNHDDMWTCMSPWVFFDAPEGIDVWYRYLNAESGTVDE